MAVKQIVSDGVGFGAPQWLLTQGLGDFSGGGGGSTSNKFTPGLVYGPDGQRVKRAVATE